MLVRFGTEAGPNDCCWHTAYAPWPDALSNTTAQTHRRPTFSYAGFELDPNNANAYYHHGLNYENLGNKTRALADFRRAFSLDQNIGKDGIERLGGG